MNRYLRGAAEFLRIVAVIEWRLFATMWPVLVAMLVWAFVVMWAWYITGWMVSVWWFYGVVLVGAIVLGRLHDFFEARFGWYNRIRFTGPVNPVFDE